MLVPLISFGTRGSYPSFFLTVAGAGRGVRVRGAGRGEQNIRILHNEGS